MTVVGASGAYPGAHPKGRPFPVLQGLSNLHRLRPTGTQAGEECRLTHAGTSLGEKGQVLATGGRVLAVTGLGPSLRRAVLAAYRGLSAVSFEGMQWRGDIGEKAAGGRHAGPLRVGILGSTRGTSVRSLIAASSRGGASRNYVDGEGVSMHASGEDAVGEEVEVVLVLSDEVGSGLLSYAREQGVAAAHVRVDRRDREAGEGEMERLLQEAGVEVLLLNGYNKVLSARFVRRWWGRCLNLHPSMLPRHAGLFDHKVHEAVLQSGDAESGCTVHLVSEKVDEGPILLQLTCPVDGDGAESVESLRARVQALEGPAWARAVGLYRHRTSEIADLLMRHPLPLVE